jgi:hypothetical protein
MALDAMRKVASKNDALRMAPPTVSTSDNLTLPILLSKWSMLRLGYSKQIPANQRSKNGKFCQSYSRRAHSLFSHWLASVPSRIIFNTVAASLVSLNPLRPFFTSRGVVA